MKFSILTTSLLELLQTVSKAVAVRTTKQVLTGILIEAKDDSLTATAYDLELGIQNKVFKDDKTRLHIIEPGSIVLPARYFADVVKKLPTDMVEIHVEKNYMTEISSGTAHFHLHGIDAAEFPKLPLLQGARQISVSSLQLKELIRNTVFATANSEVRPVLTGIHVQAGTEGLIFTATDGLRLATRQLSLDSSEMPWASIVPGKSFAELSKLLPDDETPVHVQMTDSHGLFAIHSMLFYTRLIEGSYPDTSRLIPQDFKTEFTIQHTDIEGAIERASLIARDRDNHMVRMEISGENMTVSSSSPEVGNVSETLLLETKTGDNISIAFNGKYVLDALKALLNEKVVFHFNGPSQPFIIGQPDKNDGLQLISPVLWR